MRYNIWIILFIVILELSPLMKIRAESPKPDARMKTDILLVVPHPDDETAIGSYLAKVIFDDHKRVAAVYANHGSGGGNSYGWEQAAAMGLIRETEVRGALAEFGVTNVWFLDGRDTPGQDIFHSLRNIKHGSSLERIIRIIRLTRPEVIITWFPGYVAGENHGDHQATGVIVTEAFDLAGDPTVFPAQVATPREHYDIGNNNEGLSPWQPKKLYYFSDREELFPAPGPAFDIRAVSPSQKIPYYQLAARLHKHHLTQGDVAEVAIQAEESGDWQPFIQWLNRYHLIFGKSLVPCQPTDPVFEGISVEAIDYQAPSVYPEEERKGIEIKMGGAFEFYHRFYRSHDIDHLSGRIPPEVMVAYGSYVHFPLIIVNNTSRLQNVHLEPECPEGWSEVAGRGDYALEPGEMIPVQAFAFAPESGSKDQEIHWIMKSKQTQIGKITINVKLTDWALPQ